MRVEDLRLLEAQLHSQNALIAAQFACISEQNATIRNLRCLQPLAGEASERAQLETSCQGGAAEVPFES